MFDGITKSIEVHLGKLEKSLAYLKDLPNLIKGVDATLTKMNTNLDKQNEILRGISKKLDKDDKL